MSLDLYLNEGHVNVTYNLSEMWQAATKQGRLIQIEGFKGSESVDMLKRAFLELQLYPRKYVEYNPENSWGSYEGLVEAVRRAIELCEEYPEDIWEASR
jgi:hypothetical protein